MKLITRDTDYALRAICYIAKQEKIVSVNELVKVLGVPRPFMRKILQRLSQEKILVSYKGEGRGGRHPSMQLSLDRLNGVTNYDPHRPFAAILPELTISAGNLIRTGGRPNQPLVPRDLGRNLRQGDGNRASKRTRQRPTDQRLARLSRSPFQQPPPESNDTRHGMEN